jgi:hypothetical protein
MCYLGSTPLEQQYNTRFVNRDDLPLVKENSGNTIDFERRLGTMDVFN